MKKYAIGITGGIGSGKSTVSKIFEENGFIVIKADDIAKKIMQNDLEIKNKLISEFGKQTFLENELNSKYISDIVFNDEKKLKILNSIVHPAMIQKIADEVKENQKTFNIVFVEAALIFEAKMEKLFDFILLVTANDEIRIERILLRDRISKDEVVKRIEKQIPEQIKKTKSDFIIDNNKSFEELKSKSEFFLKLFQTM
ncbi:MAG: dephospho-CoA kinase [Ignavibacteriae bacterium]|nr:dephospho-CoA kinase [Ignavibacteriota bacterium]